MIKDIGNRIDCIGEQTLNGRKSPHYHGLEKQVTLAMPNIDGHQH